MLKQSWAFSCYCWSMEAPSRGSAGWLDEGTKILVYPLALKKAVPAVCGPAAPWRAPQAPHRQNHHRPSHLSGSSLREIAPDD